MAYWHAKRLDRMLTSTITNGGARTMRRLTLNALAVARVWIGSLPDAVYPGSDQLKRTLTAQGQAVEHERLAAIELRVPRGGHTIYGLLGGRLTPLGADRLDIAVWTVEATERLLVDPHPLVHEQVHVGLPSYLAVGVLEGIGQMSQQGEPLRPGSLVLNCAAYAVVSSCAMVYKHLTTILVSLLSAPSMDLSDEELVGLFPQRFE